MRCFIRHAAQHLFIAFLAIGVLAAVPACRQQPAPPAPEPETLTVLTPHSAEIRATFEAGFWNWYTTGHDRNVRIEWIYRGTPQCVDYARAAVHDSGNGSVRQIPDLMFGGGAADHDRLAREGLSRMLTLPPTAAQLPNTINGLPTRDPNNHWIATGLSSFGILYNVAACQARDITPPTTWADLAHPRFFGWLAIADPRASGSHRECLMLALQSEGWAPGWATVFRILGNARALNARSGDALRQARDGISLATLAVNFDGQRMVAENDGRLVYVDPPNATTVTPDVISILATSRNTELANAFIAYVLSEEGQALWGVERSARPPYGETLYHYPILPAVYAKYADHMAVQGDPLATSFGLKIDEAAAVWQSRLLRRYVGAICDGDGHVELQRTWQAVIAAGLPAEPLAALTAPPFTAAEGEAFVQRLDAGDANDIAAMTAQWFADFKARCARVQAMLGQ